MLSGSGSNKFYPSEHLNLRLYFVISVALIGMFIFSGCYLLAFHGLHYLLYIRNLRELCLKTNFGTWFPKWVQFVPLILLLILIDFI